MKTLLFVSHYTGRGGGESVQLNLMEQLATRGYNLHLLTPCTGQFSVAAAALGVTCHTLPFRGASTLFIPALYTRFPIVNRIAELLRQIKPSLIHSDYHALPFAVGAGEQTGVPVLWNAMGGWFAIKPWQHQFFRRRVACKLAITTTVRRELLGTRPFMPPEDMPILIPGVNTSEFAPGIVSGASVREKIGIDPDVPLVSLIGRFQAIKGQHTFLDMARQVAAELPSVRFALAGDNVFGVAADEAYKRYIVESVQTDSVLRERVSFLGFWPDSREVIAASDVIVCSSRSESLGMVVIETMAMARPVVSTRAGGPSETVIDGQTGFLVTPESSSEFADCVLRLLRDPELRERIGGAARQHVEAHLSAKSYADQFESFIQTFIQGI